MDEATQNYAIKKLDRMKAMIGYPDQLRNNTLIDGYFRGNNTGKNKKNTDIAKSSTILLFKYANQTVRQHYRLSTIFRFNTESG